MPAFQKLIKGALEKIAKSQDELSELQKVAAKKIELMESAKAEYAAPSGGYKLYHGSPFKFDQFDFEGNLLKGEGALAFGPGGYMSGNDNLARHYAKTLYQKHVAGRRKDSGHEPLREALRTDPRAASEYLRAAQVGKLVDRGVLDGALGRTDLLVLDDLPPHMRGRGLQPNSVAQWGADTKLSKYALERQTDLVGFDEYRRLAESVGMAPEKQPSRIGQGGVSPLEVIRRGRELQRALKGRADIRPRITERYAVPDQSFPSRDILRDYEEEIGGGFVYVPGLPKYRQNLNSTWRVANSKPGRANFAASMDPGGIIDLRNPGVKRDSSEFARRLYSLDSPYSVEDMFSYDLPISKNDPRVVGALAQVAEKYGFLDSLSPDMRGADFVRRLSTTREKAAERMRAMKEAGVPAMYFLRDGPRQRGIPSDWDPKDHNFVIFDQDRLPSPDFEEFATGGSV